ncbi:hypothetical protein MKX03_014252 [Papaver bracteatum]|nr:hypothetical protein MKX03_014252 [Papaver bracteatum]
MDPLEQETLFKIMESMSSDRNWRVSNPCPCKPGSSWPGLECKTNNRDTTHFHVIRLDFGSPPITFCSNTLTGIVPETIEKLKLLAFLALSNNRLKGKSFPQGITKLVSLEYLLTDGNSMFMSSLPNELRNLVKLQELRLGNSGYSGAIPTSLSHLMNLTTLSLENNILTGDIPVGLSNLSHIYHLNLSRNMLSGLVPFNNGFLKRLGRNLDLSGNPKLC